MTPTIASAIMGSILAVLSIGGVRLFFFLNYYTNTFPDISERTRHHCDCSLENDEIGTFPKVIFQ